ncbi:MAG: hypothetical protein OEW87_09500, partial [Flavobacteriaceae bacterium]|nr:hypothetical protein [Flavobacteriaceae bacterium]
RLAKLFTLIGLLSSILGYLFLLYKGYNLSNEISDQKKELGQLEEIRIEKIKQLTELENQMLQITSSSKDTLTVKKGEKLAKELGIPTGKYFTVKTAEETSLENAKKFEEMGFEYLLDRNVEKSIESFIKSENSYNSYHQVYEIARFLAKNKNRLSDKSSDFWIDAYQTILTKYSWKMPDNYKLKLEENLKLKS